MWKKKVYKKIRRGQKPTPGMKKFKVKKVTAKREICNTKWFAIKLNESLNQGEYQYPFSVALPPDLPGSYEQSNNSWLNDLKDYKCGVSYMLWAELIPSSTGKPLGRAGAPVAIMQRPNKQPQMNLEQRLSGPVTTWCCCSKGNADITTTLSADCVSMDDQIVISTLADHTNLKIDVKNLRINVIRKLTMNNGKGEVKQFVNKMWSGDMGKIPKCTQEAEPRNLPIKILDIPDENGPKHLGGAANAYTGRIQQTVTSQLLTVEYFINVCPNFDGTLCCAAKPELMIPIEILAPEQVCEYFVMEAPQEQPPADDGDDSDSDE